MNWRFSSLMSTINRLGFKICLLLAFSLLWVACGQTAIVQDETQSTEGSDNDNLQSSTGEGYDDYEIVTLLPRDAIPAIDNPQFVGVDEANESYDDDELILGVDFNDDARAYSIPLLSTHEIVNDTVGGVKLAVTW